MNSILKKSLGFVLVIFLMVFSLSSVVKVKATETPIMSANFEEETGHRTSGSNSYAQGPNTSYTSGGIGWSLSYADSVTSGSPLAGSANILGRIAGNSTNSPIVQSNSIGISNYTVNSLSYKIKGVTAMNVLVQYSTDNSIWNNWVDSYSCPSSVTTKTHDGKSIEGQNIWIKFTISVESSTKSNRDFQLDDIVLSGTVKGGASTALESISLTNVALKPGQTGTTNVTYTPANATDKVVSYEITAGSEYAEVAADGTITAKAAGVATLTVTPHDTNASAQTCSITVTDYPAPALTVGKSYILYANDSHGNYQLSGVTDNLGTGASFDGLPDEDVFPLEVEAGIYVNTIAFKNGDNYLSLDASSNNLYLSGTKNANSSWLVSNEGGYTAYNVVYQTRRIQFNYNSGNVRFACYAGNNTAIAFYEIGSTSVTITSAGNATKAYIGDTLNFNVTTNVQNPVVTWNSSNTSAATIDSNGVLHPAGIGRTNITATINDVESDSIGITILPNPESPITVAQANAIADLVGNTKTTEVFILDGSITYSSASSVTLTDNTGSIIVYKSAHGYTADDNGKEVRVTGKIIKYENTTNELTDGVTITLYHTVTFNSNGGSAVASQKVLDGAKATRPTPNPTKDGFTFNTWKNAENIYDFNSAVTADLNLTAEWVGSTGTQILNLLNSTQAYMSLAYKYSVSSAFVSDVLVRSVTGITNSTYTDWEDKTVTTSAVYKGKSAGSNSSIQIKNGDNSGIVTTTSGGYARLIIVTFEGHTQEGRTLDIYGSNSNYTTPADLYAVQTQGTKLGSIVYGTSTALAISGNYQYIGIKSNDGTIYCSSIEIIWGAYDDSDFRLRCGFDNSSFADDLAAISGEATYGIEVSTSTKTSRYASTNGYVKTSGDMKYVLIDLGDALTNSNRLDIEFTVKVYVELDEVRYYATNDAMTKTYSVASMVNTYYANDEVKPLILNLYNLLVSLGKINN